MALLPLNYAFASLTVWHVVIWLALSAPMLALATGKSVGDRLTAFANGAILIAVMYCWVAPIVGQAFGQKFSWAQIWPSGFILATVFTGAAALHFSKLSWGLSFAMICVVIPFFGFGFSAAYWALPRLTGPWLFDLPEMPWGVSL